MMTRKIQSALLAILSFCAVPHALHAQDWGDRYQRDRYEHQRYERDRHDRYERDRCNDNSYRSGYANGYAEYSGYPAPYDDRRGSAGRSIAIVGGSAAAGAIIGSATGRGQGAAIGAFVGGITGLIVDQATRDHRRYGR